jgi:phosphotransferase system HPr (HPr) family protein
MKELHCKVNNGTGVTSRISAELVAEANRAEGCDITLVLGDNTADLKSIMNRMSLVIRDGQEFLVRIEGSDEDEVYELFASLLQDLRLLNQ